MIHIRISFSHHLFMDFYALKTKRNMRTHCKTLEISKNKKHFTHFERTTGWPNHL